jgi:mono/diheme cytochrome c family protein
MEGKMDLSQRLPVVLACALAAGSLLIAAPAAHASTGKQLFDSRCATCHKKTGAGGLKFGTVVSADLRSPGLEKMYKNDDNLILRAILQGRDEDGQPLDAPMPHWNGVISKKQALLIVGYLKTLCCSKAGEPNEPSETTEQQ